MKSRTSQELGHFLPFLKLDFGPKVKKGRKREKGRKDMDKPYFPRSCSAEGNGQEPEDLTSTFMDITRFPNLKSPEAFAQGHR